MRDRVAIVGYGYVGKAMHLIFPDAVIYDITMPNLESLRARVNGCGLAIICVPTPMKEDGDADVSAVYECVDWIETNYILIKSAVPPGTCIDLCVKYRDKRIAVSPEYIGEGNYQITPWKYMSPTDPRLHDFMIVGAEKSRVADAIFNFFIPKLGPEKIYFHCTSIEAEIIKYMENSWNALKVIFAHEFYRLCGIFGASYIRVREGWTLDNRVEKMHTAVFVNKPGFDGKCLPKDVNAIVKRAEDFGVDMPLMRAVLIANERVKSENL